MAKRIGELLVESGAVSAADVSAALARQKTERKRLGELLVAEGKLQPIALAKALAAQFELPFVELRGVAPEAHGVLPIDYQAEHRLVAFRVEKEGRVESLHVAVADPTKLDVVDELRFQMARPIKVFVAAEPAVAAALEELREDSLEVIEGVEAEDEPDSAGIPPEWSFGSNGQPPAPSAPSESLASPARGTDPSLTIDVEVEPPQTRGTDPGFSIEVELTPVPVAAGIPVLAPAASAGPGAASPTKVTPAAAPHEVAPVIPPSQSGAPVIPPVVPTAQVTTPVIPAVALPPQINAPLVPQVIPPTQPTAPVLSPAAAAKPTNGAASRGTDPSIVIDVDVEVPGPITGGAAALADAFAPDPTPTNPARPMRPGLSEDERKLLESLERLARGQQPLLDSEKIQPARMAASLVRLLIKKGVIQEMEFLDELARK